jgi:hypothetical protein
MLDKIDLYIIVVTFNMLEGLNKTLSSINNFSQSTEFNIKIIVINGNPDDSGYKVVDSYGDLIFRYIAETDRGIYDAMNKGIRVIPQEGYSIFINSDDKLIDLPQIDYKSNVDAYFHNVLSYDHASQLIQTFHVKSSPRINSRNILRPRLHHQGFVVKNSILKQYEYNTNVGIRSDVLLMATILSNHSVIFSNKPIALISTGGKSDSYNLINLFSFFYIAPFLNINRLAIILFSFPEITKYSIKLIIGKKGLYFARRIKYIINSYIK